jgi:hypothetical protein
MVDRDKLTVVIPHGNPGELLVRGEEVGIGAVLPQTRAVVVEGEDLVSRLEGALVLAGHAALVLVDVVAQMDLTLSCLALGLHWD